jgi:predicted N-acyltransferase
MWCIEQGYLRFEGGAQGEHKMARALLPTPTASAHWIAHPDFRSAIARFLQREQQGISAYQQELNKHSPLKTSSTAAPLRV